MTLFCRGKIKWECGLYSGKCTRW